MTVDVRGFGDSAAALTALNHVRHFVGLLSVDGILLEANTAALVAGGLDREAVIGKPFWDAHWWSYDRAVQDELRAAIERAAHGESVRYDVPVRAADGGRGLVTIDFSLTPLRDDEGLVRYLVPEGHPISDSDVGPTSTPWAELLAEARRSRDEADLLGRLATSLAAVDGIDAVASIVIEEFPEACDAVCCTVAVREPDGGVAVHRPAGFDGEVLVQRERMSLDDAAPWSDAIRTIADVVVTDMTEIARRYPALVMELVEAGVESIAVVPVVDGSGTAVAAIALGWATPGRRELEPLTPLLALAGAALRRALWADEVVRSAALLDTLVRQAPVGIAFFDRQLRFAMVNELLADVNGLTVDDHQGKRIAEIVPELAGQAVPLLRQVLESGEALTGVHITGATAVTSGPRTWEESFYPVMTPDGETIGVGAIAEDITDRLRAAEELVALTERLKLALRASGAGVFEWTPESGSMSWTVGFADLYGFDATTPPDFERWIRAVHPDDRDRVVGAIDALPPQHEVEHEFRIVHPTEGVRWMHSVVTARRPEGSGRSVIGINSDVTERKQREDELERLHARQREVAERIQVGLLPTTVPEPDGYEVAAAYVAGTDGLRVGGDWYDVIHVGEHDVAIVVGDVVGHDLDAAIAMAQLRNATVGLTYAHAEPVEVLADLDQLVAHDRSILGSTVFYARLDPRSGTIRYARAGHVPPIIVRSDGVSIHERGVGAPLGVASERSTGTVELAPGEALVAFTDGLVERRGESIETGLRRLTEVADGLPRSAPLASVTDRLLAAVPRRAGRDDVALVAIRRR